MANPGSGALYAASALKVSVCQAQNRGCGFFGCVDEMFTIPQDSCSIVFMEQSHREASVRLFELVQQQQGYFTTKQAKAAGFAENTHPYHVQAGNWIREHRGIYRLALFPATDRPDLALWSLWSSNRKEEVEGVYSHQTAISLFNLSDLNPAKLHMTVPMSFRRNSEIPGILVLHYADLPASDVQTGPGYKITRPLRTAIEVRRRIFRRPFGAFFLTIRGRHHPLPSTGNLCQTAQ